MRAGRMTIRRCCRHCGTSHWIFPGSTVDVTTVKNVKDDLRGWKLSRCVFVGDAGMVSEDNLRALARGSGKYIVCMPLRRGSEVAEQVITRPGRHCKIAENLRVKEVTIGEGERRRRYVVCHNPQEEQRQNRHRAQILTRTTSTQPSGKPALGLFWSILIRPLRDPFPYSSTVVSPR